MRSEMENTTNAFTNMSGDRYVNGTYLVLGIFHSHIEQDVFRGIELLDSFSMHEWQD